MNVIVKYAEQHSALLNRLGDACCAINRRSERFLGEYVPPGLGSGEDCLFVQKVGQSQVDEIALHVIEQGSVICEPRGRRYAKLLTNVLAVLCNRIGYRRYLYLIGGILKTKQMPFSNHSATADYCCV